MAGSISGLLDGSFVALDQKTGKIAWRTQLEDYKDGYSLTGAYRYYDGLVFMGISGAENGIRGRVTALDAKDGHEVWRFYTVPARATSAAIPGPPRTTPIPTRPRPIRTAAPASGRRRRSTPTWACCTSAPATPAPTTTARCARATTCSPRRSSPSTTRPGQYKWHFQEVHHDIWDFDAPSPTVLFDQMYNGTMRKGIFQPGKTGWIYFLDRTNGQPLIGINETPVRAGAAPGHRADAADPGGRSVRQSVRRPVPGFPLTKCIYGTFWDVPVVFHPLGDGGSEWSPTRTTRRPVSPTSMGSEQDSTLAVRQLPVLARQDLHALGEPDAARRADQQHLHRHR